jgi:MFS family permease
MGKFRQSRTVWYWFTFAAICFKRLNMIVPTIDPFRRIVWPLAIAQILMWAAMYYLFPALLLEWEIDLGWSKTELSVAFTMALVVSAVLAPAVGRLIDRGFGSLVFTGSAVLGSLLLTLLSMVTKLWQFYTVWILIGMAMSGGLYEACFAILTRVMGTRAKQAITFVTLVAGFAGTLAFPGTHALLGIIGWRGTVLSFAAAIILIATPLNWFGCRFSEKHAEIHAVIASHEATEALSVFHSARFWLLALAYTTIALDHGVLLTHLLPLLDDRGIQIEAAVFAASMLGPMQVAGRLAIISAGHRVSTLGIFILAYISMAIAALSLLGSGTAPIFLVSFILFQGAGFGVMSILRPVMVAELFGRNNFGLISGSLAVPYLGAAAAAPTIAALIWWVGGYDLVILFALAASGIGLVSILGAATFSA